LEVWSAIASATRSSRPSNQHRDQQREKGQNRTLKSDPCFRGLTFNVRRSRSRIAGSFCPCLRSTAPKCGFETETVGNEQSAFGRDRSASPPKRTAEDRPPEWSTMQRFATLSDSTAKRGICRQCNYVCNVTQMYHFGFPSDGPQAERRREVWPEHAAVRRLNANERF
jgi:hypothetical protein